MSNNCKGRVIDLESEVENLKEMLKMQDDYIATLNVAINELELLCNKKYEKLEEMNPELEGGYRRSPRKHRTRKYRNKKRGTKRS